MPLRVDESMLQDLRRFNRKLALAPRVGYRHPLVPMLGQCLLRLTQLGGGRRMRLAGIRVERQVAAVDGLWVPVRVLRPPGAVRGLVLDIHGGGWVVGNPEMNDALNAAMVRACGVAVVSVDYRLAPRAPIRAIMDDCLAAARWRQAADVELAVLPEAPHGIIHFPTAMGRAVCAHTHAWIRERLDRATAPVPPAPAGG